MKLLFFLLLFISSVAYSDDWFAPVRIHNRKDAGQLKLTEIGAYGIRRKARPGIPSHLHTGIDIKRPGKNYENEPVLPACMGKVISIRDDGPFAQVIIEHNGLWTVYEHVADIKCKLGEIAHPQVPIARFFNTNELNKYGWKFDHFHFEIMKARPVHIQHSDIHPDRFYATYALLCYDENSLRERYLNPLEFFNGQRVNE
ncbi:MAG: hypothetical protein A2293_11495 [Elusimicrobia bacterium RIFOXYB2_FULL_49_7]|nr:MAG: hypothetical protein A2293_11495 [Elusimicrobia bacterium RIFOXYB2_FULL_49_7]